jgi:hypothetical protein
MPNMDGIEATNRIRTSEINYKPYIVAMTAYSMKEDKEKFIHQGFDDYIAKPIKADALTAKVIQMVKNQVIVTEEEQQASDHDTLLDKNIVDKLIELSGQENILFIYEEFENETIEILERIQEEFQVGDAIKILNNLHTLKGVSGTLGAWSIHYQSQFIEQEMKTHAMYPKLKEDLNELIKRFNTFKENYKQLLTTFNG